MALTITEQLAIIKGVVSPSANTITELVEQVAVFQAKEFKDNQKIFDGGTYPDAQKYLDKITTAVSRAFLSGSQSIESMVKLVIAIYGQTGNYATVESATDTQWESFISNNILEVFEDLTGVTAAEKAEYDGI
jgi:hypothetical protein